MDELKKINILSGANLVKNTEAARLQSSIKTDSFKKNAYITPPKKYSAVQNVSVNNLYSPSQLLNAYTDFNYVKFLIDTNPQLQTLLAENGLDVKIYPENIKNVSKSHLTSTTAYAMQIANQMNISEFDKRILEQACTFHDFGKILIPNEILEKPGQLDENEKKIMDLHSEIGYELLSKTGMNKRVLDLIKNHHKPQTENTDVLGNILSVADIYSALIEERSYKPSMSEKESLAILDQKAKNGEVSTEVVNALKASLSSTPAIAV